MFTEATLASGNPLDLESIRKNIKANRQKINGKIVDEKLQYDINREAVKISALSSGKIDKYEYLTGEEILPSHLRRVIEWAKFTYSHLEKALEKHKTTITTKTMKSMEKNCFNLSLVKKMNTIVKKITKYLQNNLWRTL